MGDDVFRTTPTGQTMRAPCDSCGAPVTMAELLVSEPADCAGMLVWSIPPHDTDSGAPCEGPQDTEETN